MNTCIEHLISGRAPFHDISVCRCLIDRKAIFARREMATQMRLQPENIDPRLKAIEDWITARREESKK